MNAWLGDGHLRALSDARQGLHTQFGLVDLLRQHLLFLFTEHGDCVAATPRPGNMHSADDRDDLLLPTIDRQHAEGKRVTFRADAAQLILIARPFLFE